MKKIIFYSCILITNLIPFIPLSNKGILGLVFILICSIIFDFRETIRATVILIILAVFSYGMDFSVDYENPIFSLVIGSLLYAVVAFTLSIYIEKNRKINNELTQKIILQNSLMRTTPIPLFTKDLSYKYTVVNQAFEEFFGNFEDNIIGKTVFDLFDKDFADKISLMDMGLVKNKEKQVEEEIAYETKDGNTKTLIVIKALITNNMGEPIGIIGVIFDITEHYENERLKEKIIQDNFMIQELQEYDQLKTDFFANISHELRTPLNVISSAVQLVEMYLDSDSCEVTQKNKIKKNILNIKQNSYRLQRLVNNLIDMTKIDANSFAIRLQNLDIIHVVEEITLSVADFAANKGIYIEFDTNVEEKKMAFDEEKVERIVLNLLSNAIKFTPPGGCIIVCVSDKEETVTIEIKDTGIGIPEEETKEIFNRFYQMDSVSTRNQEGSGIGLNLVKALVEMHQGQITVESTLGKGTTFTIELPCKFVEEEATRPIEPLDRKSRIEHTQLEFSDIYEINNRNIP